MSKVRVFLPGQEVWVVERDENGTAGIPGLWVYVSSVGNAAILTDVGFEDGLEAGVAHLIAETARNFDAGLSVFPHADVYPTRETARAAWRAENRNLEVGGK